MLRRNRSALCRRVCARYRSCGGATTHGDGWRAAADKRCEIPGGHIMRASDYIAIAGATAVAAALAVLATARADSQVDRGKYLVSLAGCNDCHTPGYFFGKPDMNKYLGGSEVAFEIPGLGAFPGRNITPDKETGIGSWTKDEIVTAITTGRRPDGRELAPIMPYCAFANLTTDDAAAIVAFLQSIPPVKSAVVGPFGPGQKVSIFTFRILPPGETVANPPPNK
jgi:mono/diheme cytochrome c family protein